MAVNLSSPSNLKPVPGVRLASVTAGIRYQGRDDLVLVELAEGSRCAAVFTQNKCCAAPVTIAKKHLAESDCRAWLINAGNANAVTGQQGYQNAITSCEMVAQQLGIETEQVLPFSTGVIGEQLNMAAFEGAIPTVSESLADDAWMVAAKAIMTTDTVAKAVSQQLTIDGQLVTLTGMAKGSGMICPNMATMLAYVATDANIEQADLEKLLKRGTAASFNRITVDSDTSTNDALVLAATGKAQTSPLQGAALEAFYAALEDVLIELATAIVRDGEGASKFIRINVSEGHSEQDCAAVAYSIAHSPLVKTALFASDPNWGRILMAMGKAPVESLLMDKVSIRIGDVPLIKHGQPVDTYTEAQGQAVFSEDEITLSISLGVGKASYHVWTSDLSHDYVSINADYRS